MRFGSLLALVAAFALGALGCGQSDHKGNHAKDKPPEVAKKKTHDHSGWWCDEHGIPEHECSMCSEKVAKECKAKGDWCAEHERAKSQCFVCDPKLQETFAAKYRAKYGEEPPPIEDELVKKAGKK